MSANPRPRESPLRAIRHAITFLTVIPMPSREHEARAEDLAESRLAYPLAGGLIGLLLAGLSLGLDCAGADRGLSAFLLVTAGVAITGGLHLDGLADSFDGLFLAGDSDRRLDVMRDPRTGSFGVVAIVLVLLGKFAALSALAGQGRTPALLGAATIARALILVAAGSARYARPEGTGRIIIEATTPRDALIAAVLVVIAGLGTAGRDGLIAGLSTLAFAKGFTALVVAKLGGITGDTLGALVEIGELGFLLILVMM